MKLGIILETKDAEKSWNAFRFANTAIERGHDVKLFLMGEAVEVEQVSDEPFNTQEKMIDFEAKGGHLLACETCLISRQINEVGTCDISTMSDAVELVEWADKIVTF